MDDNEDRDNEDRDTGARPGPIYDRELRLLTHIDPAAMLTVLGIAEGDRAEPLDTTFVRARMEPDVLIRVGDARIMHIEYQTTVRADLVARMLTYRGLIMQEYPRDTVEQHIIVLRRGRVTGYDELERRGFALRLGVVDLWRLPAERFLVGPNVAPLAGIAFEDPARRGQALVQALSLIALRGGGRREALTEAALTLATMRLDAPTIMRAAKESGMIADSIAEHFKGTELEQIFMQRGEALGREQGIEQGIEQGRAQLLTLLLEQRFGAREEIELVARRLARMSEARAFGLVTTHDTFEAVLAASADPH